MSDWQRWLGLIFSTNRIKSIEWLAGNIAEFMAAAALRQMRQEERNQLGIHDATEPFTYPDGIDFAEEAEVCGQAAEELGRSLTQRSTRVRTRTNKSA